MSTSTPSSKNTTIKARRTSSSTSTVFVEIPPFDLSRYQPLSALKENTPLRPPSRPPGSHKQPMPSSSSATTTSMKRKLPDSNPGDANPSTFKRVRTLSNAIGPTGSASAPLKPSQINSPARAAKDDTIEVDLSKVSAEFPNGWTYCHQCCKKRDLGDTIHCTAIEAREVGKNKEVKSKRCVQKFCKACLKNRYNEELDDLKRNKKQLDGHVTNAGFYFHCYKCRDECNCPRCRKSKGLEPIGNMTTKKPGSREKEKESVSKNQMKKAAQEKPKVSESAKMQEKPRAKAKSQSKTKTLPPVKWTPVASALSRSQLEERIYIREFLLRFNHLSEAAVPKAQLEELEQLNGNGKSLQGVEELDTTAWVSESCVKAIIISLLGLFTAANEDSIVRASQMAIRSLKPVGLHLTKVWGVLLDWQNTINASVASTSADRSPIIRDDVSTASSLTELSDTEEEVVGTAAVLLEEPQPLSFTVLAAIEQGRRATRGMTSATASNGNSVPILSSSQMIPVILSLIDHVLSLGLQSMKEDMDQGLKILKELARKVRECIKGENERWEIVRKERESQKDRIKDQASFQAAKQLHKDILTAFDQAPSLLQSESLLRYTPLGSDPDRRVYHILSPGQAEREAAFEYIDIMHAAREQGVNPKVRLRKKGRAVKSDERDELVEFSWMVLVWGRIPNENEAFCPNTLGADEGDDTMSVDGAVQDHQANERWYAFSQPDDIRHLADWVSAEYCLDKEEGAEKESEDGPMNRLVKGLKDFAALIQWRSLDNKYRLPNESLDVLSASGNASAKGTSGKISSAKTKAIPPERFYDQK